MAVNVRDADKKMLYYMNIFSINTLFSPFDSLVAMNRKVSFIHICRCRHILNKIADIKCVNTITKNHLILWLHCIGRVNERAQYNNGVINRCQYVCRSWKMLTYTQLCTYLTNIINIQFTNTDYQMTIIRFTSFFSYAFPWN